MKQCQEKHANCSDELVQYRPIIVVLETVTLAQTECVLQIFIEIIYVIYSIIDSTYSIEDDNVAADVE